MKDKIESYLCINIAIAMFSVTCMFVAMVQKKEIMQTKEDARELVNFITMGN